MIPHLLMKKGEYMKKSILILASLALWGCKGTVEGKLTVHKDIVLHAIETVSNEDDPFCRINPEDCRETEEEVDKKIKSGEYKVKLSITRKNEAVFEFKKSELKIQLPEDKEIPEENGDFSFRAGEIGQRYDIAGQVRTDYSQSDVIREHEQCRYQEREYVCYPDRDGRQRCGWDYRWRYGYRRVEYRWQYTHKAVSMNIIDPTSHQSQAQFVGDRDTAYKQYLYEGICR